MHISLLSIGPTNTVNVYLIPMTVSLFKVDPPSRSEDDLVAFYCTVIRSVLEYGSQVWSGRLTQIKEKQRDNPKESPPNYLFRVW